MSTRNGFQTWLVVLIISMLMVASTTPQVSAQLDGEGDKIQSGGELNGTGIVPGGPGFVMVSAFDFVPTTDYSHRGFSDANLYNPNQTQGSYSTGVALPHGAKITKLTLYYKDNNATEGIYVYFGSSFLGSISDIASFITQESYPAWRTHSVDIPAVSIDNQNNSYYLNLVINPSQTMDMLVSSVRIDYAYINSVPFVAK